MAEDRSDKAPDYNLEGGQRHLLWKDGQVKAIAPGLRLVEATEQEEKEFEERTPQKKAPKEYGLPV